MNDRDLNAMKSQNISSNLNKYYNFLRYGKWILKSVLNSYSNKTFNIYLNNAIY